MSFRLKTILGIAAIEAAMLGVCHSCANPLTAHYGITHGVAACGGERPQPGQRRGILGADEARSPPQRVLRRPVRSAS